MMNLYKITQKIQKFNQLRIRMVSRKDILKLFCKILYGMRKFMKISMKTNVEIFIHSLASVFYTFSNHFQFHAKGTDLDKSYKVVLLNDTDFKVKV